MRVMVIVKATKDSEAGVMPSTELLTAMGKYNEQVVKAGTSGICCWGGREAAAREKSTTESQRHRETNVG